MQKQATYLHLDGAFVRNTKNENAVVRCARSPVILAGLGGLAAKYVAFYMAGKMVLTPDSVTSVAEVVQNAIASSLGSLLALAVPSAVYSQLSQEPERIDTSKNHPQNPVHFWQDAQRVDTSKHWGENHRKTFDKKSLDMSKFYQSTIFAGCLFTTSIFTGMKGLSFLAENSSKAFLDNFVTQYTASQAAVLLPMTLLAIVARNKLLTGQWKIVSQSNFERHGGNKIHELTPATVKSPTHSSDLSRSCSHITL